MHVLIIANGPTPQLEQIRHAASEADLVIAANGGTSHALAAGIYPDVVVGDLDSLPADQLEDIRSAEVEIVRHAPRKNETDFELALAEGARRGATRMTALAAVGGRLDQTLSNIFLMTLPAFIGIPIRILTDIEAVFIIREHEVIRGEVGDTVSLVPLTPQVEGVTTRGLEYPLENATLTFGPSLSISNALREAEAEVTLTRGVLLVVHARSAAQPPPSKPADTPPEA